MGKRRSDLQKDGSGQFYRQIGRKLGLAGQPKFRLGSDRAKADLAYHKLGALWDLVVADHERKQQARTAFDPAPPDPVPLWTDEALEIAEAIRKHVHTLRVAKPQRVRDDAAYATYIDYLRQRYGHLVQVVPADLEAAERGRQEHQAYAEHRSRQARLNARIASIPVPSGVLGKSLYHAIDAYADRAVEQMAKESGKVEAATARRLKASTPDMDLGEFGYSAIERIRTYWAARPEAKLRGGNGAGRAISLTTVDNHLSTARRFVRWLDRSDAYAWEMPRHGIEALTVNLKRLRTGDELASRRHGVKVLGADALAIVYRHATDFERLLLLLGLNAAMAQAEIITLRWDEVEVDPPAIKRIRRKTSVYGEFALWDETQAALGWWRRVRPPTGALVMVTSNGQPYTRTRISNAWGHVRDRIARDAGAGPDWWLPFKHLRKSAAQFVRRASDGEVAGTFLSHGTPVATDDLADRYSNRPFDKVAAALGRVRQELSPMFAAAPHAFQGNALGRGPQRQAGRPSA